MLTVIWRDRWNVLATCVLAFALVPMVALPLFWLLDIALHWLLRIRPNPYNWNAMPFDVLRPMYLGLGPPAAVTGLAIGAWRSLTGHDSLVAAAVAAAAAATVQLRILIALWPDTEPPELPFRLMEIALVAAFTLTSLMLAALVRSIGRSRPSRRKSKI